MVFENQRKLPSFLAKKDEESISKCQKCLENGHWTFECKNKRVFLNRKTKCDELKELEKKQGVPAIEEYGEGSDSGSLSSDNSSSSSSDSSKSDSNTSSSSDSDASSSSESDTSSSSDSSSSETNIVPKKKLKISENK